MDIYIVQEGDTITSISNKFGVTVDRLITDNGIINTANLVIGQTIVITYPKQIHIVRVGDTLSSIAETYGITIMRLLQYNSFLAEREYLNPGESLVISYSTKGDLATHGFLYPHINRKVLIKTLPLLSYLSVFNYRITEKSEIVMFGEDSDIIKQAIKYGTIPILMISSISPEGQSNVELIYEILLNKEVQEHLIKEIINLVKTKGYYGLNIMVSGINTTNQQLYIDFLNNISTYLKKEELYFFITINLNVQITDQVISRDKLDYKTMSRLLDGIIFLQYYLGTNPGAPKPVNNLSHIKSYIDYVETLMPQENMIIGLTLVGYDWELPYRSNMSKVSSLSSDGIIVLAHNVNTIIIFDDISQTPFYNYKVFYPGGSVDHVVWFIDARSINSLLELNYENGILGSGIWSIMVYNQQLWSLICSKFIIIKYLSDNLI